jgi:hypothetical protein
MFDAGGQHFKGKASKYTSSRAPQALSFVPRSATNTIRYSFKSRERYAAGLSLAPLLFLNSLCRMAESLVLLLLFSGSSTRQSCFSSARWMTPRVPIINANLLFVPFQADVVVVLQILLDTSQNTPPAATSTTRRNTSYGAAMHISVSPVVRPSSRNDRST